MSQRAQQLHILCFCFNRWLVRCKCDSIDDELTLLFAVAELAFEQLPTRVVNGCSQSQRKQSHKEHYQFSVEKKRKDWGKLKRNLPLLVLFSSIRYVFFALIFYCNAVSFTFSFLTVLFFLSFFFFGWSVCEYACISLTLMVFGLIW